MYNLTFSWTHNFIWGPEKYRDKHILHSFYKEVMSHYTFSAQNGNAREERECATYELGAWSPSAWVQILPLRLTHCETLGKGSEGNTSSIFPGLW